MNFDTARPQLTTQQVLASIPGLARGTLAKWVERKTVLLSVSVGKGHHPLYRGSDVIQLALVHEIQRQGVFVSKARLIWHMIVNPRLIARQFPRPGDRPVSALLTLHPSTGELLVRQFHEASAEADPAGITRPDAPDFALLLRTDRFIDRIIRQMERVIAGLPAVEPAPLPEAEDFARRWTTDEQGRRVFVGLTYQDSVWYARFLDGDQGSPADADYDRFESLQDTHERARMQRISQEAAVRSEIERRETPGPLDGLPNPPAARRHNPKTEKSR